MKHWLLYTLIIFHTTAHGSWLEKFLCCCSRSSEYTYNSGFSTEKSQKNTTELVEKLKTLRTKDTQLIADESEHAMSQTEAQEILDNLISKWQNPPKIPNIGSPIPVSTECDNHYQLIRLTILNGAQPNPNALAATLQTMKRYGEYLADPSLEKLQCYETCRQILPNLEKPQPWHLMQQSTTNS